MANKVKYVAPSDAAGVDKLIDQAVKGMAKAKVLVQIALVGILIHAAKHNDYSRANIIVEKLVGTVNANAIVKWFVQYGGLIVAEDGSGFNDWQGPGYITAELAKNWTRLDEAKETMWYEFTKPNPFAGYNAEAELHKFMKRYAGMRTKTEADELSTEDKTKVDLHVSSATIDALMKLVRMELIVAPNVEPENEQAEAVDVHHLTKPAKAA